MPAADLKTLLASTASRRPVIEVPADELGTGLTIAVRHLTLADRISIDAIRKEEGTNPATRLLRLLCICLADESGAPIFTDPDDADLHKLPAAVGERAVMYAIQGGADKVDVDAKKA